MTKNHGENLPITAADFARRVHALKRGSVTRRHFLGVTGLGLATAVMARFPGAFDARPMRRTSARRCRIATWPNYHDPQTFETFTAATGVAVEVNVFGSNEEMLAKLQAGGFGLGSSSCRPTTRSRPMPSSASSTNSTCRSCRTLTARRENPRFTSEGKIDGKTYAVPKNWGTTGIRRQYRQDQDAADHLERFLRGRAERSRRPRHGARLPAHDDRQCAGLARLQLQFDQAGGTRQGRGVADQGQAASLRHQQRLPARYAGDRRLDDDVLDQ